MPAEIFLLKLYYIRGGVVVCIILRLMHAQTGFVVLLSQLGIIKAMPPKPPKSRAGVPAPVALALGSSGKLYSVVEDSTVPLGLLEGFLKLAESKVVRLPTSAAEIPAFADTLQEFAIACRSYKINGQGLVGGLDPKHRYLVKHFLRAMLFLVETLLGPEAWDDFTMAQIVAWTPDEENLIKPLKHMTGFECRRAFSISPLLLSCFLCLADDIKQEHRSKAVAWPREGIWRVVRDHERRMAREQQQEGGVIDPSWPPGPRVLWEEASQ